MDVRGKPNQIDHTDLFTVIQMIVQPNYSTITYLDV